MNKGGRPRRDISPASQRRLRNARRIYLGDTAERWQELKSSLSLTDSQLAEHLLDSHDTTCNCKQPVQDVTPHDPWDRSLQPECLLLPSVSTPRKNKGDDITSNMADLSFASSMPSSFTDDERPEVANTGEKDCGDVLDDPGADLSLEYADDSANITSATLGESIGDVSSEDEFLNMSLPEVDEPNTIPGPEVGDRFMENISMPKCIAFVDPLFELVKKCIGPCCQACDAVLDFKRTVLGTALLVNWKCINKHSGNWSSQPRIGTMFAGNLQMAADILLTGNSYTKIAMLCNFMNLGCVAESFFYNVQRFYCLPAIETYWTSMQLDILTKLQKGNNPIVIAGDGRNDSPGHTAQYCTYTMMDAQTEQIVSLEIVDVREAPNSVAMEKIGFQRCMDQITKCVTVTEVVTDQSPSIALTMRTKYPDINHQWDVWHATKNLEKKLTNLGNTKKTAILRTWAPSIRNHFWYCSKMCEGNEDLLKETWMRILHHVTNKHVWSVSELTSGQCSHGPLDEEEQSKPWFDPDSEAMDLLRDVVLDRRLIGNMRHFTNFRHTGSLEVFHNHLLMYCSKRQSYKFPGYRTRNLLAAIDYNHHINRPHKADANGETRQKPRFNKRSKNWSCALVKVDKAYSYKYDLQCMIFEEKARDPLPTSRTAQPRADDPRRLAHSIAKVPCPRKAELIAKQKSRF